MKDIGTTLQTQHARGKKPIACKHEIKIENDGLLPVTCPKCGGKSVRFEIDSKKYTLTSKSRNCICGRIPFIDGALAYETHAVLAEYESTGYRLRRDHRLLPYEFSHDSETKDLGRTVLCSKCDRDYSGSNRDALVVEAEDVTAVTVKTLVERHLICDKCKNDMQFGWSGDEADLLIWPVDAADFNPNACFPEERFWEEWLWNGNLSPGELKRMRDSSL